MDKIIMDRVQEHYEIVQKMFRDDTIIGIFLIGKQNYGIDINSTIHTQVITAPSIEYIIQSQRPVDTCYYPSNTDKMSIIDIRIFISSLFAQKVNTLETLFTEYRIINPMYQEQWNRLKEFRESICRWDCDKGRESLRYRAIDAYDKIYYACSLLHADKKSMPNALRLLLQCEDFIQRFYIEDKPFEECLRPRDTDYFKAVQLGLYEDEDEILNLATKTKNHIEKMCEVPIDRNEYGIQHRMVNDIVLSVREHIITTALRSQLENLYI